MGPSGRTFEPCHPDDMKTNLKFFKQDGRWYADVPEHSLEDNEMVLGADEMCELLSNGKDSVEVEMETGLVLSLNEPRQYLLRLARLEHDDDGATYSLGGFLFNEIMDKALNKDSKFPLTVWLCNVTHTVFGEHPEVIFITKVI